MPTYPVTARRDGIEGTITVAAHVDSSGLLCSASVVGTRHSSMRSLAGAALDAMARWRLEPARRAGKPVESVRLLAVHFKLTN
jgi:protein TonB